MLNLLCKPIFLNNFNGLLPKKSNSELIIIDNQYYALCSDSVIIP